MLSPISFRKLTDRFVHGGIQFRVRQKHVPVEQFVFGKIQVQFLFILETTNLLSVFIKFASSLYLL